MFRFSPNELKNNYSTIHPITHENWKSRGFRVFIESFWDKLKLFHAAFRIRKPKIFFSTEEI